ncbi:hypothetical protein Tco_1038024 [Tanacetum coccineum]
MAPNRRSNSRNDENPDIAAIIAQQMQNIIPQIVTQVTNNMNNNNNNNNNNDNNANNGNGGNNGCSYKTFLDCNPRDYDGKGGAIALNRWIEKMKYVYLILPTIPNQSQIIWEVEFFEGWKPLSPLQLAVEEVMSE